MLFKKPSSANPSRDPDGRMPLIEHLRELRSRLVKAMIGLALGLVVGFLLFETVWDFLQAPYCDLPQAYTLDSENCTLVFTGIFDAFFLRLKVSLILGLLVSSPVWLYQLWAFVTPAMYTNERRYTIIFIGCAVPLFFMGAGIAYVVTEQAMRILFSFSTEGQVPLISMSEYLNYMIAMLLVFGASFLLPLFVVLLNFIGVLTHERIAKWRRMIIFLTFVFAAVATPGGDPFSFLALALPMIVLFEVAKVVAYLHDRRKASRGSVYEQLDDDEASPLEFGDTTPESAGQDEPTGGSRG
ncbi:twin-arginine translocase subunit TatC [Allonocardiopsis opalescens]|uniref:Sec-independent protein translocase protein TatC n=1 Tax=Allonocardiopsis opalescens TaxID=1144618 RepID=A0A2T0PTW1_9ACTN|nr:twin-arginine translocase subunit TatC [Allonocardiopsis opalescens]PRX92339.1 sec-independent protein translocase protein TatC [Allonocardiopsis opalescens]